MAKTEKYLDINYNALARPLLANLKHGELLYLLNTKGMKLKHFEYLKLETKFGYTNCNNFTKVKTDILTNKITKEEMAMYTDLNEIELRIKKDFLDSLDDLEKHRKKELDTAQKRVDDCKNMKKYLKKEVK